MTNTKNNIRITINSNTFRVITVDKVENASTQQCIYKIGGIMVISRVVARFKIVAV